jgi:hypothetical protein
MLKAPRAKTKRAGLLWPATLVALIGCGSDSSGPNPDDYKGLWTLAVQDAGGCSTSFVLMLAIADVTEQGGGEVGLDGAFWFASDPTRKSGLGGGIDSSRSFDLHFVSLVLGSDGATFVGSGASPSKLEGTFTDVSGEMSGTPGCAAHAVATK